MWSCVTIAENLRPGLTFYVLPTSAKAARALRDSGGLQDQTPMDIENYANEPELDVKVVDVKDLLTGGFGPGEPLSLVRPHSVLLPGSFAA